MSSLLRSTKLVRYFCGAARTLILNSARNVETSLLLKNGNLGATTSLMVRDYATTKNKSGLEPLLESMDWEIRRSGRVTKRHVDELFNGIKVTKDLTSSQALLVIRCCGELLTEEMPEKRTLLVKNIWSVLSDIGVPMDISHYNALLRVYIENEYQFSPAEFLEELTNKGLQPNNVTYQRLMWRYCQQGDIDGATRVLENMRELGYPITIPVLNALVLGHSTIGDTEGAKAVLNTVMSAGLQANNHTYTLLACGYAKNGDLASVQEILTKANEGENFLTNKNIFSVIEAFAVNGHVDKIEALFDYFEHGPSYRQDAHNAILRLINKGQEEVAKTIFQTYIKPKSMDEVERFYKGAFYVKQLLKASKSPTSIVESCKELQEEGLIPNALLIALEAALQQTQVELAQHLLEELHKREHALRHHYFWPLLVQKGKEKDEEGVLQILRSMSTLGLTPNRETIQNYVVPYLKTDSDLNNVMIKLQIANIPTQLGVRCVIQVLLQNLQIQDAVNLVRNYDVKGNAFMKDNLVFALTKTKDISSFVEILQITSVKPEISDDSGQYDGVTGENTFDVNDIVLCAVKGLKRPDQIENLLTALLSKGIGISSNTASLIEEHLGQNMTPAVSETLTKLTADDLEISPIKRTYPVKSRTIAEIEILIANLQQKGAEVQGLQKQLLTLYMKDNNVEKVEGLVGLLESDDTFTFTQATYGQLIDFYCENNNVDKALHYKNILTSKFPEYKIYNLKSMNLVHAFIKANRVNEAFDLIKNGISDGSNYFSYNTKCWQVLNELAEQKDPEKLQTFFNLAIEKKFMEPSNVLLGPLIKVHILNNDLSGALDQFEKCCKLYRSTPWKGEIMKQLIVAEDATKLQWIADLSTQIHGEVNVLYDLILAFIECGRLRQARRILQTPGLQMRNHRLNDACKRYASGGQTECIEGLLEASKELSHIDRANIFYHLLTSYVKANETDKALGLWNHLQEEGEVPSDKFLNLLGDHLKSNNRDVPFVIPTNKTTQATEKPLDAIRAQYSNKIENLLKSGKSSEALKLALKCLGEGIKPFKGVASYLLKVLSDEGDVKSLLLLKPYYEQEGNEINYHHKLTLATVMSGSSDSLINALYNDLKNGEATETLVKQFPKSNALNIIIRDDNLADKCEEIAKILAAKDQILPVNLMWMEYIINGQDSRADALWQQHLHEVKFIKFRRLLQYAFVENKPGIIKKLISYLEQNKNITPEALGNAYSRLISVHLNRKDYETAKTCLGDAVGKGLHLKHINSNILKSLKAGCQDANITYEFETPLGAK